MSSSNIAGGDYAPQHRDGLFNLLGDLDQAAIEEYLAVYVPADGRGPASLPGPAAALPYDLEALRRLVDELWPPRPPGARVRGRRPTPRLPVVCALLRVCDPEYGVVHNLSEEYSRLQENADYRKLSGFPDSLPSPSVFFKTSARMVQHWGRFQACLRRSPSNGVGHRPGVSGNGHAAGEDGLVQLSPSRFHEELKRLNWAGNLPPLLDLGGTDPGRVSGNRRSPSSHWDPERRVWVRDWHLYNEAQTNEGLDYFALLGGLADIVNLLDLDYLPRAGRGKPRCYLGTMIFCLVHKAYSTLSARRLQSQLKIAASLGYLRAPLPTCGDGGHSKLHIPAFNTVLEYQRASWMTPILLELVTLSAAPVRRVETGFAVDGTGWSIRLYERWLDHRLESESTRQGWVKLHLVSGVSTNVVARAVVSPGSHHDNPYFRGLVAKTTEHFDVRRVMADMAYSSRLNHQQAQDLGFALFVPYKANTVAPDDDGTAWSRDWQLFDLLPAFFYEAYHKRSNVESTNSSLKRLFPAELRTEEFEGHVNELLCKLIAYNLVVSAREMRMRGIVPDFPSEVPLLEDVLRGMVEIPVLRAA